MTSSPAARVVMELVVAGLVLADLGAGMWLAPSVTAQSAAPYHWARKRSHFRLPVGDNVSGDWNAYLRATLDDWNQNETITLIEVKGATNPQYCEPVAGTVQVCNWMYGTQEGWLGLTRLYFNASGTHIDAATVQLNDSFMYAPNSPYNSDAARRHTLCHELGHTIGLDHQETTSCMNHSQHAVFNFLTPINEDFRQLRQIYEHADATRTVERQDADLSLFAPTSQSADPSGLDSEEDVMVLPLDEETQVLTFIVWADEEILAEIAVTNETDQDPAGEPGLDPTNEDTDGDGVADRDELNFYRTDPAVADTDGDGVIDGDEIFGTLTDPLLWEDFGTVTSLQGPDGAYTVTQVAPSTVFVGEPGLPAPALEPAPDAPAGTLETAEPVNIVEPESADLDADNYADAQEREVGLDPTNPDTDADGVADGDEPTIYGTDPLNPDTDGDGATDGEELFWTDTDPLVWNDASAQGAG